MGPHIGFNQTWKKTLWAYTLQYKGHEVMETHPSFMPFSKY